MWHWLKFVQVKEIVFIYRWNVLEDRVLERSRKINKWCYPKECATNTLFGSSWDLRSHLVQAPSHSMTDSSKLLSWSFSVLLDTSGEEQNRTLACFPVRQPRLLQVESFFYGYVYVLWSWFCRTIHSRPTSSSLWQPSGPSRRLMGVLWAKTLQFPVLHSE